MQKEHYIGMDLHSNNTYIGILDQDDKRVFAKRAKNKIGEILEYLQPFQNSVFGIVVESTFNWYWLVDSLMDAGYKLHLAHPPAITQYKGLKHQDDKHSAFFLAKLLKLNILPEGYIFPKEDRHIRDLLRKRSDMVHSSTKFLLSFKSLLNRNLSISMSSNDIKKLTEVKLEQMFENKHLLFSAKSNVFAMRYFIKNSKEIEKEVLKAAELKPEFQILTTTPGIGIILGLTIALETGNINRFDKVGNYASYCRAVSSERSSNNKRKGSNNRKNGNKYLAWAFLEAAHKCRRFCPQAEAFYKRKTAKTNKIVAIKALAHKLARACFYMMKDNIEFDVGKIFGTPVKTLSKGCDSKPVLALDSKPKYSIGNTVVQP